MSEKIKAKKPTFKKSGKGLRYPNTAYFEAADSVLKRYGVENIDQVRWKLLFHQLFELVHLVAGRNKENEKIQEHYKADLAKLNAFENSLARKLQNELHVEV